ncbi:sensor histidine kinase [Trinickia acidisoli]|uniref:sensor histidine kinase n=1 Tax=Trinickia acidisoli TaxID=2767482 RepID=UPI001A908638|nr:histidine kinase [Trinickia acidisoli]
MYSEPNSPIPSHADGSRPRFGTLARRAASVVSILVFNCVIGLAFWIGHRSNPMLSYLVVSNAIGFSAMILSMLLGMAGPSGFGTIPKVLLVAAASVVIGVEFTASTVGGVPHLIGRTGIDAWLNYGPSFLVAGAACSFIVISVRAMRMRASLETQRREAAELRQSETAARLALLQAQIEPHFLFNTLANVQSLIERDPSRAASMLDSLNRYLRASLSRTRNTASTLDDELELVQALLNIATIRLGDRLRYTIDVPEPLRQSTLAPLLLQPLVENALLHGIEPSIEGGEIRIVGRQEHDMLVLDVIDTGVGLGQGTKLHGGVGLSNVRARLGSLYGERGRVSVAANANAARGVTASLSIPIR